MIINNITILTNSNDWLFSYIGRISTAIPTKNTNVVQIIAYSDDKKDMTEIKKIAKENNGIIINNISIEGEVCID